MKVTKDYQSNDSNKRIKFLFEHRGFESRLNEIVLTRKEKENIKNHLADMKSWIIDFEEKLEVIKVK